MIVQSGPLAGRVAVVTGAGSGQGRATTRRLVEAGARAAAIDVDGDALRALARELPEGTCVPFEVDVSSEMAVADAFARVWEELGPAYAVLTAAAIYPPPKPIVDLDADEVRRILEVNVLGTFHCVKEGARQMIAAGEGGRIVCWSSVGARITIVGYSAYCGSKGAVESIARTAAAELGPHGIAVNVIAPGAIDTPMIAGADLDLHASILPSGRIGQPEDVAELALFLCSSEAVGFVTGATFTIDGGATALNGLVAAVHRLQPAAAR